MTRPVPKSKRARFRYILFIAETEMPEKDVVYFTIRHLTSTLSPNVKMIRFKGDHGIVRVWREEAIIARRVLDAKVETPMGTLVLRPLLTSGTLRSLKERSSHAREVLMKDRESHPP